MVLDVLHISTDINIAGFFSPCPCPSKLIMLNITAIVILNTILGHFIFQGLPKHLFKLLLYIGHIIRGDVLHQIFHRNLFDSWEKNKVKIFCYLFISRRCTIFVVKYFGGEKEGNKRKKFSK